MAGHLFNRVIEGWERDDLPLAWSRIARYIIGVVIGLPVYIIIRHGFKWDEETERDSQAYITSFVGIGVGVAAGYLLDDLNRE